MPEQKFEFPSRGFHIVADKFGEADYFLELMREKEEHYKEFEYALSAFASAARSITFSLQAVMSKYPEFSKWYIPKQEELKKNKLAKFFLDLRNHLQKVGSVPVASSGSIVYGNFFSDTEFVPIPEIKEVPVGNVIKLAESYLIDVLEVLKECYHNFSAYVDPRAIFTTDGLSVLGWSIEDLEEALGFPRGYTDVEFEDGEKDKNRLKALSRYGGDEEMEQYFEKYLRKCS